jgi:hypothetical protein
VSTLLTLTSDLVTFITAPLDAAQNPSGPGTLTWTRETETLSDDFRIDPDEAGAQILVSMASVSGDSNINYYEADVVLKLAYHAANKSDQEVWLTATLDSILRVLLSRSGWRALASVHDLVAGPEAGIPERIGRVSFLEVVARVALVPE